MQVYVFMYIRSFLHVKMYVYVTVLDEDAPSENASEGQILFEWVKDYEMKVQSHQMEDSFLFYLDERSVC